MAAERELRGPAGRPAGRAGPPKPAAQESGETRTVASPRRTRREAREPDPCSLGLSRGAGGAGPGVQARGCAVGKVTGTAGEQRGLSQGSAGSGRGFEGTLESALQDANSGEGTELTRRAPWGDMGGWPRAGVRTLVDEARGWGF